MSNVEHYFENLLFHGHDIKGEPNKKALSKEVQDAVEQCVNYIKYTYKNGERKTGKWEIYVISMRDGEGCRCSECGFEGTPYWDYCPNCGAKMEGIENE